MADSSVVAYCLDCPWRGRARRARDWAWKDHDRHLADQPGHTVRIGAAAKIKETA